MNNQSLPNSTLHGVDNQGGPIIREPQMQARATAKPKPAPKQLKTIALKATASPRTPTAPIELKKTTSELVAKEWGVSRAEARRRLNKMAEVTLHVHGILAATP